MKRIGLIALALVLSLGLLGVGLAQWTETLDISGSVATGELDAEFTSCSCSDSDEDMPNGGEVSCVLSDGDDTEPASQIDDDTDVATITIDNAYPGYWAECTLTIHNNGSIPAKINLVTIDNSNDEITVTLPTDPASTTIDPSKTVNLVIKVLVNGNAEELATYTFDVTVDVVQGT